MKIVYDGLFCLTIVWGLGYNGGMSESDMMIEEEIVPGDEHDLEAIKDTIFEYIKEKDIVRLRTLLHELDGVEALFVMNSLSRKQKALVFRLLDKECALFVFEQLEIALQKELLESFTDEYTREVIEDLDPDDRAGLFDEMPAGVAKKLLSMLSNEERQITNMLMGYEPETAGRIMTPKFISLKQEMTAEEALNKVRLQANDKETVYILYVTDDAKKLDGVLALKHLLIADSSAKVKDIMNDSVIKVTTDTDQEEAAKIVKEYDFLAVPVVDKEGRIVGIITHDDAMDILEHEATEDMFNQAGLADITGKETNRSEVLVRGSLWAVWKVRLPFLLVTLAAGLLTGTLISGFEETLAAVAVIAVFMPMIMDMGGSVGTQSTTVFARGVALGQIDTKKFLKHLSREAGIGLSIGLIAGAVTGGVAAVWGYFQSDLPLLGLAVGLAVLITVTLAAVVGFLMPFLLLKLKLDQAAGAAPLITAVKDLVGISTYFILATLLFSSLINADTELCGYCIECLCNL